MLVAKARVVGAIIMPQRSVRGDVWYLVVGAQALDGVSFGYRKVVPVG